MKKNEKLDKKPEVVPKSKKAETPGDRIKELRKRRGLTQAELAAELGYHIGGDESAPGDGSYISHFENGRNMSMETAYMFSKHFGVSLDFILCKTKYETEDEEIMQDLLDHFYKSQKDKAFCSSLGVSALAGASLRYYSRDTGEEIRTWEEGEPIDADGSAPSITPEGANIETRREYLVHVMISGNQYVIELEKWASIIEIAKGTALAALKVSCSEFDQNKRPA